MRLRPQRVLFSTAVPLLLALAAAVILGCSSSQSSSSGALSAGGSSNISAAGASGFDGAALPANVSAPDFTLADQQGKQVGLREYRGQVTVLAFLYSRCGAACVVIAQQIRGALDELAKPVPVVIVSADPAADTPASVSGFLRKVSLNGRVRYLSGPVSQLRAVWRAYRVTPASSSRAAFARSATVLLLDAQGRERVVFGQEQLTPESLSHDIGMLQAGSPQAG
jgi:protein SCO1/2